MNVIDRNVALLENLLVGLSSAVLFLLMLLAVFDAFGRHFGFLLPGVFELSELLMVGLAWLGVSYVTRRNTHIRATFIVGLMPRRLQAMVRLLVLVVAVLLFAAMLYATSVSAYESWVRGTARSGLISFPEWPAKAVLVMSVAILLIRLAIELFQTARGNSAPTDSLTAMMPE